MTLTIACASVGHAQSATPNLTLTPGVTRPLSKATICKIKWGRDARHVTETMRRQVFAAYGIPWEQHTQYEVDHLMGHGLGVRASSSVPISGCLQQRVSSRSRGRNRRWRSQIVPASASPNRPDFAA